MDEAALIAQPYNELYEALYREANSIGAPFIPAADSAAFLKRSNLNVQLLGQIWEIADYQKRGALDRKGFFIALKLVAAAQQGHPVSASSLSLPSIGPPALASRSSTPSIPNFPVPSMSSPTRQPWAILPQDQAKYEAIFESLGPQQGRLSGAQVRPVLMNSGLNPAVLGRIWELADMDKDGYLDKIEMSLALHLVYRTLQNEPLPSALPPSLIHPTKAMLSRRTSTSSMGGPPPMMHPLSYGSRHGSVASLDGIQMQSSPVPQPQYAYDTRSVSAQPHPPGSGSQAGSAAATPLTSHPPSAGEWPIDKWVHAEQFALCDGDGDGLVSGQDVRPTLLATGLPASDLATIWSLADIRQQGVLNHEQFALVMHLVAQREKGEPLPSTLPSHLMPPSLRLPGPGTQHSEQSDKQLTATLEAAAASGNEEVKQLAEEMQRLLGERRETEKTIGQLEADMATKNGKIKTLQVELQTLEGTVKQLERQMGEAKRRLGDFDTQIAQLEAAGEAQKAKGDETRMRIEQLKLDALEGDSSAERDRNEMEEAKAEIVQLEEEARKLKTALEQEHRQLENVVTEATKAERETERDARQTREIEAEMERVDQMAKELQTAVDADADLAQKMHLLGNAAKQQLFNDAPFTVASTSSVSSTAAHINRGTAPGDPFAQTEDPFSSGADFSSAFPVDPFAAGADPFAGTDASQPRPPPPAGFGNKPPPPRPAPPKSSSARQTPVAEDAFGNTDPFQERQPQATNGGFANFANFGAFS